MKFLFLFLTITIHAQNISGKIYDEAGSLVPVSSIFLKTVETEELIDYTIARDGNYNITQQNLMGEVLIVVNAKGYISESRNILIEKEKTNYSVDFILKKDSITSLDEVVVIAKKRPYTIHKDTIKYNVGSFKDGTERKIEDIIKKLPGIEINEVSGEIKYKGKPIETVTLDGDNLFGFNYTLGTKNLNVDMVEQIQAIDNYSENWLLKGIEQGGKVALNLKLKKGKFNFSGDLNLGNGLLEKKTAININSNILSITKAFKSFFTLACNNIGINHSPFDYFGFSLNPEQLKEQNYFASKIIPETRFTNLLDGSRTNINKQFFGNYNAVIKVGKRLSIRTNLYYLQDKISTNQFFKNQYQINKKDFTTSDNVFITKKPQQYRGDLKLKYISSKTSLLEYDLKIRQENIETPSQIVQNESKALFSFLKTEDFYLRKNLLWTKKLTKKKALQISLFHSFNDLPQSFRITPSLSESNVQESNFKKTFLEGKATFLASGKRDRYSLIFGSSLNNSLFKSDLFNSKERIAQNDFEYIQKSVFSTGGYHFNRGNWQISPSYAVNYLKQDLNQKRENQRQESTNFIFEPAFKIKYLLNSISFLTANMSYNQNTNAEQYFFLNQILTNNRTTIKNIPSLELQSSWRYSLQYFNNDLYNQFLFNIGINYQKSTGNFFSNLNITEKTTRIEYFFLPQNNNNWNIDWQVSKYFPFIESTVKITSNYSISSFKNIVNNSELRKNKNQLFSNAFFWKSAFDIPINFENIFTWQHSNSKSEEEQGFINNALQNSSKIIIKPSEKLLLTLSLDYFLSDTQKKEKYFLFFDTMLRYYPKNKKWEATLVLRNLTNEKNFEQIQTSDVSESIYRVNLLPRLLLLNLTWNF